MNTKLTFILTFATIMNLPYKGGGQIVFNNPDFESNSFCDPSDCEESEVTCIEGWWNYVSPSSFDDGAWIYYDDYFLCDEYDLTLESCGDERGMLLTIGTGSYGFVFPATNNPFLGLNNLGAYEISFYLNIIDKTSNEAIVSVYVDDYETSQTPATEILVGEADGFFNENYCYEVKIGITDPEKVEQLVSHEFLIFKIQGTSQPTPPGPLELSVDAVIDEVQGCSLLDIQFSSFNCDELCINLSSECIPECDNDRHFDPELDDCFIEVFWFPNDEYDFEEVIDECYFPFIGTAECCITPTEPGSYFPVVSVNYLINGVNEYELLFLEVEHQPCTTVVISSTTTWTSLSIPEFTRFELITVNSGVTLTISDDAVLKFCEDGKLVINPGGVVNLYGTLTADCENGWLGVEVQGDGTTNQFPLLGLYPQGLLECFPDSKIEYAVIAVKLYGPDPEDTGGQFYANGAYFINNQTGIYYAPFHNYLQDPGKPRDYFSSIRNCVFDITEEYPLAGPFRNHIQMTRVKGINIKGTSFGYHRNIANASSPAQYGIGIRAHDAGFNVGPSASNIINEPCLPPCVEYKKCSFHGLGIGISVHRKVVNRPFQVYGADFSNCYFGIQNNGVSGGIMLFNNFEMGAVQNLVGEEDQVGISNIGYMLGMTIEYNQFYLTDQITDHSLGITVSQSGDMDHVVRSNKFVGISVGNEAFGINADLTFINDEYNTGLHYLCNENTDVQLNDFYFPDATSDDYIRNFQGLITTGPFYATGNTFSTTGDPVDGDFGNYGDNDVRYFYFDGDPAQEPLDYVGISQAVVENENTCIPEYCLHPCLDNESFGNAVDAFYAAKEGYEAAINEEEYLLAVNYQSKADSNVMHIIRYIEYDTSAFNRDTLRAWYHRAGSVAGELLLAGDYFSTEDYSLAISTIDSIITRYPVTVDQTLDLRRMKYLYYILQGKSVFDLTSSEMDSILLFSQEIGAASSLSISLLTQTDTIILPRYYIPGEVNPRSTKKAIRQLASKRNIKVYPNPVSDILIVEVFDIGEHAIWMEFMDISGRTIDIIRLVSGSNELDIKAILKDMPGTYLYRIAAESGVYDFGKLVKVK